MSTINRLFHHYLVYISSNAPCQRLLEKKVRFLQSLMGIGTGSEISSSGEVVLFQKLVHLHSVSKQPLCVFDVGANQGNFLKSLSDHLKGVPYHIHAFEPSKSTFDILTENIHHLPDITLNNCGLGKEKSELELFSDHQGSGLASLYKRRLEHLGIDLKYREKVRIKTLSDYCGDAEVERIDLLKLDVEGHELEVLQGGQSLFKERKVGMVSFEFGGCNIDSRTYFQDFWYFFKENGMDNIFRLTPTGYLAPVKKYHEAYEQFRTTIFIAMQNT